MTRLGGTPPGGAAAFKIMKIHVSRSGQDIGNFSPEEWGDVRSRGVVLDTDLAWHEGRTDWIPVVEFDMTVRPAQPPTLPPSPPQTAGKRETSKAAVRSLI